jgi:hypothetical protein
MMILTSFRLCVDACFPACGPGGSCLPSTTPNQTSSSTNSTASSTQLPFSISFTCTCLPGFTGPTCEECLPGHYGPECQTCPAQCYSGAAGVESTGRCDDGFAGTGGCLGVLGNNTEGKPQPVLLQTSSPSENELTKYLNSCLIRSQLVGVYMGRVLQGILVNVQLDGRTWTGRGVRSAPLDSSSAKRGIVKVSRPSHVFRRNITSSVILICRYRICFLYSMSFGYIDVPIFYPGFNLFPWILHQRRDRELRAFRRTS